METNADIISFLVVKRPAQHYIVCVVPVSTIKAVSAMNNVVTLDVGEDAHCVL